MPYLKQLGSIIAMAAQHLHRNSGPAAEAVARPSMKKGIAAAVLTVTATRGASIARPGDYLARRRWCRVCARRRVEHRPDEQPLGKDRDGNDVTCAISGRRSRRSRHARRFAQAGDVPRAVTPTCTTVMRRERHPVLTPRCTTGIQTRRTFREPPFFVDLSQSLSRRDDHRRARADQLVTRDDVHISPAGSIGSTAGGALFVETASSRGTSTRMARGRARSRDVAARSPTSALRTAPARQRGGVTLHLPSASSERLRRGGALQGRGHAADVIPARSTGQQFPRLGAKGALLLDVRAVIGRVSSASTQQPDRHGVLPLQFASGATCDDSVSTRENV